MSYFTLSGAPRRFFSSHATLTGIIVLAAIGAWSFTPAPVYGSTIWSSSASPSVASYSDSNAYEVGVKFESTVSGYIVALRFYKGSGNTGTHIGHLWSATGTLLATATFTNETASGWQQVSLPTPVPINANTVYVASYWDPEGNYALTRPYFTTAYNNPPLQALANGTDGSNGVYLDGSSGFPTQAYDSSNYWVDVVFVPTTGTDIWSSSASPSVTSYADSNSYELGVKFQSDVSGYISALRFYKGSGNTGTHIGHLWSATGTLLATATFTNETASGWQQVSLPTPVPINANTVYVASYWDPEGNYALTRPYFTTAYDNPPLHALASGTDGSNGVYLDGSSGFPTQGYDSSNYWVGIIFAPVISGGSTGAASGTMLLSGSPSSLSFGDVTVGGKSTLPFVVTNTGSESVTISQASASGTSFSIASPALPLTLAAGQNTSFSISFAPAATGSATGSVSVVSNATNSPTDTSLSATGVNQPSVTLSWVASTSPNIAGYNVYRASVSGGPYTKLNSSLVGATTYNDLTVQAGETYYYVTTAVNSAGVESAYSTQVQAAVPSS